MNSIENNSIVLERKGPSLWITINREDKRNALNAEVLEGIRQAVIGAAREPEPRERGHPVRGIPGGGGGKGA